MKTTSLVCAYALIVLGWACPAAIAQTMPADNKVGFEEEQLFQIRVKVLDEFMERFNLERAPDGAPLPADSLERQKLRMRHVAALFEKSLWQKADDSCKQVYVEFVTQVCDPARKHLLSFQDKQWYALADAKARWEGANRPAQLVFVTEQAPNKAEKWALAAVNADFLDLKPSNAQASLSPVSHDLNFGKMMGAATNDKANIQAYASSDFCYDMRHAFFFLIKNNKLQITDIGRPTYHFLQIEGWVMVVSHFEREDENAGWLISNLFKADGNAKLDYMKNRLRLPGL